MKKTRRTTGYTRKQFTLLCFSRSQIISDTNKNLLILCAIDGAAKVLQEKINNFCHLKKKKNENRQLNSNLFFFFLHSKKRIEITQVEKLRFIKVNELKLIQNKLFYFFTLCLLLLMSANSFV